MRRISGYQGAHTQSRLERAVTARYFVFTILSSIIIYSLLGVFYQAIALVVVQIGQHKGASTVLSNFRNLPGRKLLSPISIPSTDQVQKYKSLMFNRVHVSHFHHIGSVLTL
jgi:hypothetical protein